LSHKAKREREAVEGSVTFLAIYCALRAQVTLIQLKHIQCKHYISAYYTSINSIKMYLQSHVVYWISFDVLSFKSKCPNDLQNSSKKLNKNWCLIWTYYYDLSCLLCTIKANLLSIFIRFSIHNKVDPVWSLNPFVRVFTMGCWGNSSCSEPKSNKIS
jgi:hypothetical protein